MLRCPTVPTLVLVRDLLFASKIRSTARLLDVEIQFLRSGEQLASAAGDRLIVDLKQTDFLELARDWRDRTGGRVIGFVAHVDAETIQTARSAGFEVFPHSQFVEKLPDLLR